MSKVLEYLLTHAGFLHLCFVWCDCSLIAAAIRCCRCLLMLIACSFRPTYLCAFQHFLFAAAGTEPPDDANRSTGQTYCIGTTRDGPQWLQASSPATALSSLPRHAQNCLIISNYDVFSSFHHIDLSRSVLTDC